MNAGEFFLILNIFDITACQTDILAYLAGWSGYMSGSLPINRICSLRQGSIPAISHFSPLFYICPWLSFIFFILCLLISCLCYTHPFSLPPSLYFLSSSLSCLAPCLSLSLWILWCCALPLILVLIRGKLWSHLRPELWWRAIINLTPAMWTEWETKSLCVLNVSEGKPLVPPRLSSSSLFCKAPKEVLSKLFVFLCQFWLVQWKTQRYIMKKTYSYRTVIVVTELLKCKSSSTSSVLQSYQTASGALPPLSGLERGLTCRKVQNVDKCKVYFMPLKCTVNGPSVTGRLACTLWTIPGIKVWLVCV